MRWHHSLMFTLLTTLPLSAQPCEWGSVCGLRGYDSVFNLPFMMDRSSASWHEEAKEYTLRIELAGFAKKNITLSTHHRTLSIRAIRTHTQGKSESNTTLYQRYLLPEDALIEKISATSTDGLLQITIPRGENSTPSRTIEIR